VAAVAAFWLVGLACLIAALAGGVGPVKIASVQLPGFGARSTRAGAAVIGVLALALGVVLFVNRDSDTRTRASDNAADATSGTTSPGESASPGESTSAHSGQRTGEGATILWHDTITLAAGASVNVGVFPIQVTGEFVGSSIYLYDGVLNTGSDNGLSQWNPTATPTAEDCANDLRTHPIATLRPRQGLRFCLKGNEGTPRVAYGVITSYDESAGSAEVDLTVWNTEM
jgi:hypothetical protein